MFYAKKNELYEPGNDFEEYLYVLNHLKKFENEKFKVTDIEEINKNPKIDFSNIICPSKAICEDCEYMQQCQNCMAQGAIHSSKVDFCKWKESCNDIKRFI